MDKTALLARFECQQKIKRYEVCAVLLALERAVFPPIRRTDNFGVVWSLDRGAAQCTYDKNPRYKEESNREHLGTWMQMSFNGSKKCGAPNRM